MENKINEKPEQSESTRQGNIYDVFVKNIFSRVLVFVDFLLNYADPEFVGKIDLDKISPAPTHYITPKGKEQILDLVFSCSLKNRIDAKVMILFEHAGNTFDDIPVRLLCYATSIWWQERKDGKTVLSVIYFIVVRTGAKPHHGPYPTVADWLTKDENGQPMGFTPDVHYYVVDLPKYDVNHLHGTPELRAAIGILKNMTEGNEEEFAHAMLPIAEMDDDRQQQTLTKEILNFVDKAFIAHHKRLEAEAIQKALTPIFDERAENMTISFFDELRAEGETKAGQNIVLAALRKKFRTIPNHIEVSIRNMSDPIALESLISDVIESRTLEEFENALT
ncbi:MAG: Rpn family recombination-promoting nuclease/putative transposase [Planctomycetaceae bacterium]|nr:Rpn family recombination-promoting nuclease/putative transposase [Planctomycetaceae bacterium]